jgi:dihydrofolate reductase
VEPHFTLIVVSSADGYIARRAGEAPQSWASPEEQALFFSEVEAADWSVMGRGTHEAADRPDRRRIVFSSAAGSGEWRRATQFWVDPNNTTPERLADAVAEVRALERGLILGGTRVHDWFLERAAIHAVHLTVEPHRFAQGLPIFTAQKSSDPVAVFRNAGFEVVDQRRLNAGGTRHFLMLPKTSAPTLSEP